MRFIRESTTIRAKLSRIVGATTAMALLVAGLALVAFDVRNQWQRARDDLRTQADVIALASEAALSFSDRRVAADMLGMLRAKPEVIGAALFDSEGRLFATYAPQGEAAAAPRVPPGGVHMGWRTGTVVRAVVSNGEVLGHVVIRARHDLAGRAVETIGWMTVIMAASLGVALMLAHRLQRAIVEPITSVSGVAQGVLRDASYDTRAERTTNDEVGDLVDAFNNMLDELGRRARTLEQANKALRDSEARYQLAASGSSAGLWDWDMQARTMFYSPRFKAVLGYSADEFPDVPASIMRAMHPDDRVTVDEALRAHLALDKPFQAECRLQDRHGRWVWFLITGMAQRNESGRAFRMAGSLIDVTERKQSELALQEANRAKDQFLATLAHELRNPLAPLRTGVEILRHGRASPEIAARTLETMNRQLAHMVRLIDDLLDISRISSGKIRLNIARIALRDAIDTAVEISRPGMDAAGHSFTLDWQAGEVWLHADMTRIAQAVGNLLNNASKYTPPGGHIVLRVTRQDAQVAIAVQDDGMGIPPEMLDEVFQLFTQVSRSIDQAHGGLGIGLYLVRNLVALHGGSVDATSAGAGQGSTFTVRLPCLQGAGVAQPSGPEHAPHPAAGKAEAAPLRVLVVDDNEDAAATLASLLEMMNMQARVVHDGRAVEAAALEFSPDVVLLDIGLPGLSGYDVARQLRQDPRLAGSLLVAVTGWGAESDRERAREAGFDHHLTKPVALPDLERLLDDAVRA